MGETLEGTQKELQLETDVGLRLHRFATVAVFQSNEITLVYDHRQHKCISILKKNIEGNKEYNV